jgi:hypothetical protein
MLSEYGDSEPYVERLLQSLIIFSVIESAASGQEFDSKASTCRVPSRLLLAVHLGKIV